MSLITQIEEKERKKFLYKKNYIECNGIHIYYFGLLQTDALSIVESGFKDFDDSKLHVIKICLGIPPFDKLIYTTEGKDCVPKILNGADPYRLRHKRLSIERLKKDKPILKKIFLDWAVEIARTNIAKYGLFHNSITDTIESALHDDYDFTEALRLLKANAEIGGLYPDIKDVLKDYNKDEKKSQSAISSSGNPIANVDDIKNIMVGY